MRTVTQIVLLPLDEFNLNIGNIEPLDLDSDETEWEKDSLEDDGRGSNEQKQRLTGLLWYAA